ncbi:SDR family oxidoreductase [Pseudonocardia charpentierae]|uniref:SDR family oxidoreductase n=1 Tax=Pseudonocardia charpentierae TaxID=3075545 RepID=A0ABU2NCD9_9PSEU|nr:SDR family oxidoreductase [Pseudonocardia sp. DSM 45834]MDT0351617.1 SDR family oxidoreductase [Pseudonocardia sp. DSM 45834]
MDLRLTGRRALVLGSTGGLGLAVATALAHEDARVVLCGRRGERARELAADLPGAAGLAVDLTRDGVDGLVADAEAAVGPLDIVVLNSGGPPPGGAVGLSTDAVRAAVETLLLRQVELVAAVLPGMRSRGWGRILAIGSSGVQAPLPGLVLSNIGRAGLAGYLKTLASEVAADGVTVNMLLPGRFDTDRSTAIDGGRAEREGMSLEEVRDESQRSIPVGRYGDPAEFGAVAAFLCSGPASYLTGEQVRCDGGYVASY